jgi:hypothetical protein
VSGGVVSSIVWRWCLRVGVCLAWARVFRGWCLGCVWVWVGWWLARVARVRVWLGRVLVCLGWCACCGGFGCSRVWPLSFSCFCLLSCLVVWLITGCLVVWARVGVCLWGVWVGVGVFCACFGVGWWLVAFSFVCGRVGVFCGRAKVCLSASCGLLGCCLCVGLAWCACGATTGCCLACEGV